MEKTFSELSNGDRFTVNGKEYVRIPDVRVSCCHKLNAHALNNPNEKVFFQPSQSVTVNA